MSDNYLRDPFRKILDYVEQDNAASVVEAVNHIIGARADDRAKTLMIMAVIRIYQYGEDDE